MESDIVPVIPRPLRFKELIRPCKSHVTDVQLENFPSQTFEFDSEGGHDHPRDNGRVGPINFKIFVNPSTKRHIDRISS
jgi:hypothetical protein